MTLPFTEQQCFYVGMLLFALLGFQRGWRREVISLVVVLLAVFLMRPDGGKSFFTFVDKLFVVFAYLVGGAAPPANAAAQQGGFLGPWGPILLFALIVALGYYLGNRAFPRPSTSRERLIGIVPAMISGAFVISYLISTMPKSPQRLFTVPAPNPANFVPVIFLIALIALVIALGAARARKPPANKK